MATSAVGSVETPHAGLIFEYGVLNREGLPAIRVRVGNVIRLYEPPVTVDSVTLTGALVISAWAGVADRQWRYLYQSDGTTLIGRVTAWDPLTNTATLDVAADPALAGQQILCQQENMVEAPAYRQANGHVPGELVLHMNTPESIQYVKDRMGEAYFNAVKAVLDQMGLVYTLLDLQNALAALGEKGVSIDSWLAEQAEKVIADFKAGLLPQAQAHATGAL